MTADPADAGDRGYYVYGIVESEGAAPEAAPGVGAGSGSGSDVFLLEHGSLCALVSEVSLAEFGETELRQNLERPAWLEEKVRVHDEVLAQAARAATVVPLRFGTVYRSLEPIRELLAREQASLSRTLARLRGKREWGVKCLVDRGRLGDWVRRSDDRAAALAAQAAAETGGSAYFVRKRLERHVRERADAEAARLVDRAHERLAAAASDAVRGTGVGPGSDGGVALSGSYLVDTAAEDAFRGALRELAGEYEPLGLRLELSGPWPPYSFAVGEARP